MNHDERLLAAHVSKVMAWDLRVAPVVSRWERFIEAVTRRTPWRIERWEWRTPDSRWLRYWRRNGSLPV